MTAAARQTDIFSLLASTTPTPVQRKRKRQLRPANRNWDAEARAWFALHPEALDAFCDIALELIRQAPERNYLSAKHVWERLRIARPDLSCNNNFCTTAATLAKARHEILMTRFRERRPA